VEERGTGDAGKVFDPRPSPPASTSHAFHPASTGRRVTAAPQDPQRGTALDVRLEVWLHQYTFPLEARHTETTFADRVYSRLVGDLPAGGTTTAVYFATIHDAATCRMVDMASTAASVPWWAV
jgi:hypothetical protein